MTDFYNDMYLFNVADSLPMYNTFHKCECLGYLCFLCRLDNHIMAVIVYETVKRNEINEYIVTLVNVKTWSE